MTNTRSLRIIGFLASLMLTLAAYFIIIQPETFHLDVPSAIIAILACAFIQATVQFIFFLDVWRETDGRWNLGMFISTVLLILVIVLFSIWIMNTLDYNMMPKMTP